MILPGMGVISEIVTCFSRKRVFGYEFVALASIAIAVFGFLVWAHHMFVAGISVYAALVFSLLSYLVAIPSAIKVFNWTATMYKGSIRYETPMLYAFGFIGLFTIGGLTGVFLASLGIDVHVTDTYFVVAHFHYVMVGGMVMAYMAGLHFWWPKMTGRMYPEAWAKLSALLVFVGFNITFFPQFILGYLGMPRRYHAYPPEFQVLNVLSTAGASILAVGYVLPMIYFTVVAALWRDCAAESVERGRPGVDDRRRRRRRITSTRRRLSPGKPTTTSTSRKRRFPLATSDIQIAERALQHHFADMEQQQETSTFGMWMFLLTEIMFFGGLFTAYLVYRALVLPGIRRRQPEDEHLARRDQHGGADLQLADHGAGRARSPDGQPQADGGPAAAYDCVWPRFPGHQRRLSTMNTGSITNFLVRIFTLRQKTRRIPRPIRSTPKFISRCTGR